MNHEYRQTQHERFSGVGAASRDGAALVPPEGEGAGQWELHSWQQDTGDAWKILVIWQRAKA